MLQSDPSQNPRPLILPPCHSSHSHSLPLPLPLPRLLPLAVSKGYPTFCGPGYEVVCYPRLGFSICTSPFVPFSHYLILPWPLQTLVCATRGYSNVPGGGEVTARHASSNPIVVPPHDATRPLFFFSHTLSLANLLPKITRLWVGSYSSPILEAA